MPTPPQFKNSGILRFRFGFLPNLAPDPVGNTPLLTGDPARIFCVLGADPDITLDSDIEAFGESPGHAAIVGAAGSLFFGSNLLKRQATPTGHRVQGDPNTGAPPPGGSRAGARIPAGSKVTAGFELSGFSVSPPVILVQTEVVQNRLFRSPDGTDAAAVEDTLGPLWLSSIRVAIQNVSPAPGSLGAGLLWIRVEQSHIDIPATSDQSMQNQTIED